MSLGKAIKRDACRAFYRFFRNEFDKFNKCKSTSVRFYLSHDIKYIN